MGKPHHRAGPESPLTHSRVLLVTLPLLAVSLAHTASAQLITMNEECRTRVADAARLADSGTYGQALEIYRNLVETCDSRDGVEAVQTGIARAENGLGNYDDAIVAANVALESSKQKSINALFEKARAEESLGDIEAAISDYERMIELTEMNENVAERATLYAKVANLYYRAGNPTDAAEYIGRAMELDPASPDPYVVRGDWAANDGHYESAFKDYDRAVDLGRKDAEIYATRSDTRIRMMQDKYATENVQELRAAMTPEESRLVCTDARRALDLGLRDMQMDMFVALACR